MKIAFVGLGSMGAPQARLVARAGFDLAVHDALPAAREAFRGVARVADSAADAARGAEVACVCVRDDQQVEAVVLGAAGLLAGLAPGSILLIHSTIAVATLEHLRTQLAPKKVALVDAPVTRTRPTDQDAFVFTMLGGEVADVERARAVIRTFSTDMEHMGPLGAGMATKIANNLVTWTHLVVGAEAAALAAHYGVPYEKLRRVMAANGNLTPAVGGLLDGKHRSPPGADPARDQFLASQAGIGEKDLALAIECAGKARLDVTLIRDTRALVRRMMTGALERN